MTRRSRAREVVLQLLYQHDQNRGLTLEAARQFMRRRLQDESLEALADTIYNGTLTHKAEIDQKLTEVAENWSVTRMAVVDRNLLRLAAFEILFQPDTPPKAVIDEAVELAKRYGAAESSAFVNGILDRLAQPKVKPNE